MGSTALSPEQAHALFDILTHHETYAEIENFKYPGAITHYGPPFKLEKGASSTSPVLQTLLSKFALRLPGLRDVSSDFWQTRCQSLIEEISAAELSESYDKGVLGIRKTLATAISALIEYPARGVLGGFARQETVKSDANYDKSNSEDILAAFDDFLQQLVHGTMIDDLFAKTAQTDDLSKHDSVVQAAHEYVVINLASFLHYTLVLSPEGPALLRVLENINKLVPYVLIRQTLRVGNVASMINGMTKLLLAKVSVTAVTNWLGISNSADEGMNLLQQIISTVLGWDTKDLKSRASKVEKNKEAPSKEQLQAIKDYVQKPREEHEECRSQKKQSRSIIAVLLSLSSAPVELSDAQHELALEYLSFQLSLRDRDALGKILCHHQPDHLTQAIRDLVSAYEPMIRQVHQAVDLSGTVGDFEAFLNEMIKLSKGDAKEGKVPSVEDYIRLLHKYQGCSHKFLHQVAKNGKDVTTWFQEYAHEAAGQFRQQQSQSNGASDLAVGSMTSALDSLLSKLSDQDRQTVLRDVDAHVQYIASLSSASSARLKAVTAGSGKTPYGPGMYLARWQSLLDATPITPATPEGPVRRGKSTEVKDAARVDVDGERKGAVDARGEAKVVRGKQPEAPNVGETTRLLGKDFREILAGRVKR
ncbi:PX-associated-domain-containing protein [Cryomyces antarcticus]